MAADRRASGWAPALSWAQVLVAGSHVQVSPRGWKGAPPVVGSPLRRVVPIWYSSVPPNITTFPVGGWKAMAARPRGGGLGATAMGVRGWSVVVTSRLHPPAMRPASPGGLGALGPS